MKHIKYVDNLAHLFTKPLPTAKHRQIVKGMRVQSFSFLLTWKQSYLDPSTLFSFTVSFYLNYDNFYYNKFFNKGM